MEKGELCLLKLVKKHYSGYRCLSHTCAALLKLSCWWWMRNCVCRCVSDGTLEVFVQEQKEQHPVHSPLADGSAGRTWESQSCRLVPALTVMEMPALPALHSAPLQGLQGCDSLGRFWEVTLDLPSKQCWCGSAGQTLNTNPAYARGRGGHNCPSLLPEAQLPDPAAAFLHRAHLLVPLFFLLLFPLLLLLLLLPVWPAAPCPLLPVFLLAIADSPGKVLGGKEEGRE